VYRAVYGERHPSIATTLNNLGILESRRNRHEAAIVKIQASFEMRRDLLGPTHPSTLLSQAHLASLLGEVGKAAEGERLLRQVLAQQASSADEGSPSMSPALATANLAHLQFLQGKFDEAEITARHALTLLDDEPNPLTEASVLEALGHALVKRRQFAEADTHLRRALALRAERLDADHASIRRVQGYLAELEEARTAARR
jgi:tetratricopeptide (TPR) repeat protein